MPVPLSQYLRVKDRVCLYNFDPSFPVDDVLQPLKSQYPGLHFHLCLHDDHPAVRTTADAFPRSEFEGLRNCFGFIKELTVDGIKE